VIVYTLRDKDTRPLYVGKTADIDMRLDQHRQEKAWYGAVEYVDTEIVDSPTRAKERERELIAALKPCHNSYLTTGRPPKDRKQDKRPPTTVSLLPNERQTLDAIAHKEGWSRSGIMAKALIEYARNHHPELEVKP
jgi:predicted GIY-YIG superfamily endonuclease